MIDMLYLCGLVLLATRADPIHSSRFGFSPSNESGIQLNDRSREKGSIHELRGHLLSNEIEITSLREDVEDHGDRIRDGNGSQLNDIRSHERNGSELENTIPLRGKHEDRELNLIHPQDPVGKEGTPRDNDDEVGTQSDYIDELNEPSDNIDEVDTPSINIDKVDTPSVNIDKVDTPSDNIDNVDTPSDNIDKIDTPSNNTDEVDTPSDNIDKIDKPSDNIDKVDTPSDNIDEADTPSDNIDKVDTPSDNIDEADTPSDNIDKVDTPSDNIDKIDTPSNNTDEVDTPSDNIDKIDIPSDNIDEVNTPSDNIDKVDTPSDNIDKVDTPSDNIDKGDTPSDNIDKVNTPSDNIDKVNTPIDNIDKVNTPSDNIDEADTPIDNIDKVNTPIDNINKVNTPSDIIDKVNTPSDNIDKVNTPSDNIDKVNAPIDNIDEADTPKGRFLNGNVKGSFTDGKDEEDEVNSSGGAGLDKDYLIVEDRIFSIASNYFEGAKLSRFLPHLQNNGTFSDLRYKKTDKAGDLREHSRRLGAIVYHHRKENKSLGEDVLNAFSFLTYTAPPINSPNWWLHLIGVPTFFWQGIFLAKSHLNETLKEDFLQRYFSKTAHGKVWDPEATGGKMAGGNLGPRMLVGAVEYFLRGKLEKYHSEIVKVLHREVVLREPYQGNGVRRDGCIHQHNQVLKRKTSDGNFTRIILSQVYNNNYGKEFLKNAAAIMWIFEGTKFDLGDDIEEGIFGAFLECEQWLYRHTTVEPSTVGRFIDAGTVVTRIGGLDAVRRTLKFLQKVDRHRSEVLAALQRYFSSRPDENSALEGNRYFYVSDLMAHQRQEFMASLRLLSRRTARPETIPPFKKSGAYFKGNGKGYFKGDGFLTVLVTGKELGSFRKEVFEVYDWARVPGITCQYTKFVPQVSTASPSKKHTFNDADFVGGATNQKDGIAAMIYNRPTVPLKAKKSWFFFDSVIICLGSGIHLPPLYETGYPVTTTLNQVRYEGAHTVGFKNFDRIDYFNKPAKWKRLTTYGTSQNVWLHHDAIGYVPLKHERKLGLEIHERSTNLFNRKSIPVISIWLEHGSSPGNETYAYAILPGRNASDTKEFAHKPTVTIMSLNSDQHAVCSSELKMVGVVFFEKGCIDLNPCLKSDVQEICTSEPLLILIKEFSTQNELNKHCPNGLTDFEENEIQNGRQIQNVRQEHEKKVLDSSYLKNETILGSFFSEYLEYSENDILSKEGRFLQVSVSDPTQQLLEAVLELKISGAEYRVPVILPAPPKAGDSVVFCYQL